MRQEICVFAAAVMFVGGAIICRAEDAEILQVTSKAGSIEFVGSKDDGSHKGGFKDFSGSVKLVPDDLEASQVAVEIETASLWSDNPKLTAHLQNADFFDIGKFPKAMFQASSLREANLEDRRSPGQKDASHVLIGKLTLLGVSREVQVPAKIELTDRALAIQGTYYLDRMQFGMDYGKGKIHDSVRVDFSLKLPRDPQRQLR